MNQHCCGVAASRMLLAFAAVTSGLWGAAGPAGAQQTFPPTGVDVPATPTITLIDPEFNVSRRLFTWVDLATGDIWVASYDNANGRFVPPDGKGTLIEAGVSVGVPSPALGFTRNGPEWALGDSVDYIVYTRTDAEGDPTADNSVIGAASQARNGSWSVRSLSPVRRNGPYGSRSRASTAKISYQDGDGTHYVRSVNDPHTEVMLPGLVATGLDPVVRFADTANVVVYPLTVDGVKQMMAYNLDNGVLSQLTVDATDKAQGWLYTAPEANGALALAATIDGGSTIASYFPVTDAEGRRIYRRQTELRAPDGGTWYSLEPYVHRGRSYVVAQLTPAGLVYPTSIWLLSLDPAAPLRRQITPVGVMTETRADPEIVPLATGVMVIYSKFDTTQCPPESSPTWLCLKGAMGLYRADTGLSAPGR